MSNNRYDLVVVVANTAFVHIVNISKIQYFNSLMTLSFIHTKEKKNIM